MSSTGVSAASHGLSACHLCCKLAPAALHPFPRCGAGLRLLKSDSLQCRVALLITACILYIPANIYPIMLTDSLGSTEPSTIMGGVVLLIKLGSVPVAAVVLLLLIALPLYRGHHRWGVRPAAPLLFEIDMWSVGGVCMLGVVVSPVLFAAMAGVQVGCAC